MVPVQREGEGKAGLPGERRAAEAEAQEGAVVPQRTAEVGAAFLGRPCTRPRGSGGSGGGGVGISPHRYSGG